MANVTFKDFSVQVESAIEDAVKQYLEEAGGEMVAQVTRRTPVDTGQLKNSWDYEVDRNGKKCTIGSPLENAIWTEFGTGEHALNGDGRKGGWAYEDAKGDWHFTHGKPPKRCLHNAFTANKDKLIRRAEQVLKGLD
ncbi:HK97 gp10 family phage protein [Anaerovoracaceae bacterium 41-7]